MARCPRSHRVGLPPVSADTDVTVTAPVETNDPANERPGTEGIWTFVFLDMMVFALLFLVYLSERLRLPDVFVLSQKALDPIVGLASTIFLLTSSWCMVEAVHAVRADDRARAGRWLTFSFVLGSLFVANKLIEYHGKIDHGLTPATNGFYTFYFVITGIHFVHVIGGLCFMANLRATLMRDGGGQSYRRRVENVGLFWHFVDVLWLFIFPLLYLTGLQ
jgi:nitric oxide reductase NorE protein